VASITRTDKDLGLLHKKLKALAASVAGKEAIGNKGGPVRKALMAGAKPIFDEMKIQAPVGKSRPAHRSKRTGKMIPAREGGLLRDSIRRETFRKPEQLLDANEGVLVRPNPKKAPHFHLVEFGTAKTAAHPYMRPAFDSRKDIAYQAMIQKLDWEITKVAKRLGQLK
jgi:HK97 gp10 family phage protein